MSESRHDRTDTTTPSLRPVVVLAGLLLVAAVALAPPVLSRAISLDWQIGDMRPAAWIAAGACALCALVVWALRGPLARAWRRLFPTRKHGGFAIAATACSAVLAVAGAEIAFRAIDYPFAASWTPSEFAIARFDEDLGWSYVPGKDVTQPFGANKREIAMRFDEIGARVDDASADPVSTDVAADAPAVVFVGGSYTMGHGVSYAESFVGEVGKALAPRYRVVNLGVQGYGTDQALLALRRHIARLNAKAVVYTFISDHVARNDNHDRRVLYRRGRFLGTKPRFMLGDDGALEQIHRPSPYTEFGYSRVIAAFQAAFVHRGPGPSIDLTRALIRALEAEARTHGAEFLVVHFHQARPNSERGDAVFRGLTEITTIDTRTDAPEGWRDWIIEGDDHPTPRAHARVGAMILRALARVGID